MKNILLTTFFACVALCISGRAQNPVVYFVNQQPLDSLNVEYITIHASPKVLSDKIWVELEFGQINKVFRSRETRITNADGNEVEFNSLLEALNLLAGKGYEYVDSFMDPTSSDGDTLKFLLRKVK